MAKKTKKENKQMSLLEFLVFAHKGMTSEEGFVFTSPEEHAEALEAGYVDVDFEMCNEDDTKLATIITDSGIAVLVANELIPDPDTTVVPTKEGSMNFSDAVKVELPKVKRGRKSGGNALLESILALEPGFSLFVCDGEKEASKTVSPLVARANKMFSVDEGETKTGRKGQEIPKLKKTRIYTAMHCEDGKPWGMEEKKGMIVARVC